MSRQEALERIERAARQGSPGLDLSSLDLTALPPEIGRLTKLTMLQVEENQLTALPPEIGRLAQLAVLSVWGNQLTDNNWVSKAL